MACFTDLFIYPLSFSKNCIMGIMTTDTGRGGDLVITESLISLDQKFQFAFSQLVSFSV
jgi:hypothetical protein